MKQYIDKKIVPYEIVAIRNANLLSEDKFDKLVEFKDKIINGYENRIIFRAKYLMEVSVLDDIKHPTPDAKYWQANLERTMMYKNLVNLSYDYREKECDIEIKEAVINEYIDGNTPLLNAKANKVRVEIERLKVTLVDMKKEADDRMREIIGWTEIMDKLESSLEFDKDDASAYMAKSYPLRFARQKELAERAGMGDMNGYINIAGLVQTAFKNPDTLALMKEETAMID